MGGLAAEVTEDILYNAFIPFGNITSVTIRTDADGKPRGFGFVAFEDPADAKEAIENMHDSELMGRVIKCNIGQTRAERTQGAWANADQWYGLTGARDSTMGTETRQPDEQ